MSRGLARFAAITALAFVLSRVLGLVRDQVITYRFGAGVQTSAYVIAFQVPDTLFILISGGALSTAFIPVFSGLLHKDQRDAAQRMASGVLAVLGVAVLALIAVTWLFAPLVMQEGLARRASPQIQVLATGLMRVLLLSPLLLTLGSIATSVLQSYDRFTLPAFAPVVYNLGIIAGAWFLAPMLPEGQGMYGVAAGVVIGALFFFLIQLPPAVRLGVRWPTEWPLRDPHVRTTLRLLVPRILGQSAVQLSTLFTFFLAAGLGEEEPAAYRLAFTLFVLPVGLFATSVGTVAFPALSREAQEEDSRTFAYLLRRAMRGILFFVLPGSVGLLMLRLPITKLIYQRGEFTAQDTALTAYALLFFCLGMWAYALLDVVPRAFYALQDTWTPLKIALIAVVVDIALSLLLIQPLRLGGLALAFALATAVQVLLLLVALQDKIGFGLDAATRRFLRNALLATGAMALTLWLARPIYDGYSGSGTLGLILQLGGTIGIAAGVYLGVSLLLRQEEIGTLLRVARR